MSDADTTQQTEPAFIVGIGASAGGLEALERLFRHMPTDTGMSFVVVQHLSADFKSMMNELMTRCTSLPVRTVSDGMVAERDTVYLVPPGKEMIIVGGKLVLSDRDPNQALTLPIDGFFRSLAQDKQEKAVGIILSGTGSDGSRGIRQIHGNGGLVICQTLHTAKFDGMPRSARDSGVVDLFLDPERMGETLVRYKNNPEPSALAPAQEDEDTAGTIFELLRSLYNVDFSYYKPATILRRMERRMSLAQVDTVEEYLAYLETDRQEVDLLFSDLLIGVTGFMRDPEAFDALAIRAIDPLLRAKEPGDELRIWVAGCATGEEAYSIAILIHERMRALECPVRPKIFATDVYRGSVDTAGRGEYEADALAALDPDLIDRYFVRTATGFRADTVLRSCIVFAPHNIVTDAPFTKLDLITCRNLLIYLQLPAQEKALSLFHFGLRPGGMLFLGPSESPGALGEEFETLDAHWKIYRKERDVKLSTELRLPARTQVRPRSLQPIPLYQARVSRTDERMMGFYDAILADIVPMALLIDRERRLLHKFGGAGVLLREPDGRTTLDVMERFEPELRLVASSGFHRVLREQQTVTYEAVPLTVDGERRRYRVVFRHTTNARDQSVAVLMELHRDERNLADQTSDGPPMTVDSEAVATSGRLKDVEAELLFTRENLQATIEELESSNEELQASNEELVASNEELQSTNEELNSVNEELYTVNAEYQQKIDELTELTADMDNLLRSTEVHTVFLDEAMKIRRFTPQAADLFNLMDHDLGRRFDSFSQRIDYPDIHDHVREVIAGGEPVQREVRDRDGRWYFARVLPYRASGRVAGAVITLIDISALKQAQAMFDAAFHANPRSTMLVDQHGRVALANASAERLLGYEPDTLVGTDLHKLVPHEHRRAAEPFLRLVEQPPDHTSAVSLTVYLQRADGTVFEAQLSLSGARTERGGFVLITGRDLTEEQRTQTKLREREAQLKGILDNASAAIHIKDLRGRFVLVNAAAAALLNCDPDEALGRTVYDYFPVSVADQLSANDRRVARGGETVQVEETYAQSQAAPVFLSVKFPIRDSDGEIVAVGCMSTDISVQKEATERAEQAVEQRDRFLAMLSHELRNPLAAVMSATRLIDGDVDRAARERFKTIMTNQLRQLKGLLDQLLDVARVSEGKISLHRQPVDLLSVVRDSLDTVRVNIEDKNQVLECELPQEPVRVLGDAVRLQQVLVNLLTNASRFSPGGSTIWVTARARDGKVEIAVRDEGIGLAPEAREAVFELFAQVDDSPDRQAGGLGIGLTLARELMLLHGGDVRVDSLGIGQGATFTVSMPVLREVDGALADGDPSTDGYRLKRVMVVDDNADLVALLADTLRAHGYEVAIAHDGVEALSRAEMFGPQAMVVDIGLPRLNGLEVAARLRANPRFANVPLIAMSGYGQERDRRRSLAAGFNQHLVKPFNEDELIGILANGVTSPAAAPH